MAKTYKLDWKGWWVLRTPMSNVPDLNARTGVYAVMGAKLKKVEGGIACSSRELVLFGVHKGETSLREAIEGLQKMSLGVFATKRCEDIRKKAIVYAAALPDNTELDELASILSVLYGAVPFAPKHHVMPPPYDGTAILIQNLGRTPGLPEEIFVGTGGKPENDADRTREDLETTLMDAAKLRAKATRRTLKEEIITRDDIQGLATEKVGKPSELASSKLERPGVSNRPHLVETTKLEKDDIGHGIATERVDKAEVPHMVETRVVSRDDDRLGIATERVAKPPGTPEHEHNTEFVPKPNGAENPSGVLDEAEQETH